MAINLWDRAKREQMTRRGERSNDPARVQRLTDTLHLVRERGESAETAIIYALEFLIDVRDVSAVASAVRVLRGHADRYVPDRVRSSEVLPISALMDPPMPVLTRRTIATADPLPVAATWDEIPDCNCDGCVAFRRTQDEDS